LASGCTWPQPKHTRRSSLGKTGAVFDLKARRLIVEIAMRPAASSNQVVTFEARSVVLCLWFSTHVAHFHRRLFPSCNVFHIPPSFGLVCWQ
jgi:hypothetical protein